MSLDVNGLTDDQIRELLPHQDLIHDALLSSARVDMALSHPAYFLQQVKCVDSRSGEVFQFELLDASECDQLELQYRDSGWRWQREVLDWLHDQFMSICLKGRQLGVTWIFCGYGLWTAVTRPGSDVLIYSIGESEAIEVIQRMWDMWESLPLQYRNGGEVIKPRRGNRPTTEIQLRFPDGRVSAIVGMPATQSAGHSRAAAYILFDECARNPYARSIWKAVVPASADKGGKVAVVSTANGMSDERSGDGNWFHFLWTKAGSPIFPKLEKRFLGWWLHPDRSQEWYEQVGLDSTDKAEQYPNDPDEAFLLSGDPFFEPDALKEYRSDPVEPIFTGQFEALLSKPSQAKLIKVRGGSLQIYERPDHEKRYAIGADIATGDGRDFSVGAVIDLTCGAPVAELYMKADYEVFSEQLHFLGVYYNSAIIAVEDQGGWGNSVVAYLRDGLKGRRPYPRLYRHARYDRAGRKKGPRLGFPMNRQTRPKVCNELRRWVNDRMIPYLTERFLTEARTFVRRPTGPSPAAADGCNDDSVMAWGIALEMYSQYGTHEHSRRKEPRGTGSKTWRTDSRAPWERMKERNGNP